MKKTILSKSLSYALASIAIFSTLLTSCKKKEDETPAPTPEAKIFTSVVTPGTVANGSANITGTVSISDGTAYLKLIGTTPDNVDRVYITTSQDNGAMSAYIPTANYTDDKKNTFTAGGNSGASYNVSNTKDFTLIIPVSIRTTTAAVSDVYTIWFTNGPGAFTLPAKNLKLGPVTFTLNYVANAAASFTTNTGVSLGDQYNTNSGSLLVTSGQVSALQTASYNDSPNSADLSFSELNSAGTDRTGGVGYNGGAKGTGSLWLISPSERANVGYLTEPTSPVPNITYISEAPGSVDFNTVTGTTLSGLNVGTTTKVKLTNNGTYQFVTASGKKGLIKVTSLTGTPTGTGGGSATVSVKVLN